MNPDSSDAVAVAAIEQRILLIRGERVILDADLARFYGVSTKRLNEQVKRNLDRFPVDFMFELTPEEKAEVVAICDHLPNLKYSRVLPVVFTEHGAIMAASLLNSPRAVRLSVFVVRAFVALRRTLAQHEEFSARLETLEERLADHDDQIIAIVHAIRKLLGPDPVPPSRRIGFIR